MHENTTGLVRQRQVRYASVIAARPGDAALTDCARTASGDADAFHGVVIAGEGDQSWRFGIHRAIGGYHDLPNPGDILCAALGACLDSTLRMLAERSGLRLDGLEVRVSACADARGCLRVDPAVQTGFQSMSVEVGIKGGRGAGPEQLKMLAATAEQCCVVLQTLRNGVPVTTSFGAGAGEALDSAGAAS